MLAFSVMSSAAAGTDAAAVSTADSMIGLLLDKNDIIRSVS
jgi:hypothetical protein